ncbi:MAG: hypothetical protein WCQ32_02825 [bacterium]
MDSHHQPPSPRGRDIGGEYKDWFTRLSNLSGVLPFPEDTEGHTIKGYVPGNLDAYQAGSNEGRLCFYFDIEKDIAKFDSDEEYPCEVVFDKITSHVLEKHIHVVHEYA